MKIRNKRQRKSKQKRASEYIFVSLPYVSIKHKSTESPTFAKKRVKRKTKTYLLDWNWHTARMPTARKKKT